MLSRLKGIETSTRLIAVRPMFQKSSDMLSRLKGIETFEKKVRSCLISSSDMLSRLKGIETNTRHPELSYLEVIVQICFPV